MRRSLAARGRAVGNLFVAMLPHLGSALPLYKPATIGKTPVQEAPCTIQPPVFCMLIHAQAALMAVPEDAEVQQ